MFKTDIKAFPKHTLDLLGGGKKTTIHGSHGYVSCSESLWSQTKGKQKA